MGEYAGLRPREVYEVRDRAVRRINRAGWLSVVSTTGYLITLLATGFQGEDWGSVAPYIAATSTNYFLAYAIFQRRQWPAVILLLNFVAGALWRAVSTGVYAGLVVSVLFGYPIALGVLGALDYAELLKEPMSLAGASQEVAMSTFRSLGSVALLAVTAACAAAPRTARVGTHAGCYALIVADWHGAVAAATGLRTLPNYVALDTMALGPRGYRLIVPPAWQGAGPNPEWASWRYDGSALVLTFVGSAGILEVQLHPTPEGFGGEGVTPLRNTVPPVRVTLATSSCVGLRAV